MSLREAISEIADDMDREADGMGEYVDDVSKTIRNFAKQLRMVLKAAGDEPARRAPVLIPEMQHVLEIEKAKAEFRKGKAPAEMLAEDGGEVMADLVGLPGADDGIPTMVRIDGSMPVGAKMLISGFVFVLGEDRKLHCSKEETEKIKGGK